MAAVQPPPLFFEKLFFNFRKLQADRNMTDRTLEYYKNNCQSFSDSTFGVDFRDTQERFLRKLSPSAHILDFGCGSGRDTLYFLERGFRVTATDGSPEMCRTASANTGHEVIRLLFSELDYRQEFDGIWACASILHLSRTDLGDVFRRMEKALKPAGTIYTSFKYGTFEGMRNGRYFTDFTPESFREFLARNSKLRITDYWITADVRPGRSEEKWLNLLLRN